MQHTVSWLKLCIVPLGIVLRIDGWTLASLCFLKPARVGEQHSLCLQCRWI
jgi:hypothetical protein